MATDAKRALDLAIFAINTFMAPDASADDDVVALEVEAESTIDRLIALRDWCEAQGEDLPDEITGNA